MDFALTDDQQELRLAARRYLGDRYPVARIAALAGGPGGSEAASWPELVRQGWLDADLGMVERVLLAEESGYHLHPTPWWTTTALAAPYLLRQGWPCDVPATFADGTGTPAPVLAQPQDGGWLLTGTVPLVAEAGPARLLIVHALTPDGPALFTVDTDAAGLQITELATLDTLRPLARVEFASTPAQQLAGAQDTPEALRTGRAWGSALLAGEAVGVAARALDMAVGYAGRREQFGRPIGGFQAVAHQLADAYVGVELARSLAYRAGWLVAAKDGSDADGRDAAIAEAVIAAREAAVRACETAIQVSGGMGVTWEYPLHRWMRRALWLRSYAGLGRDPHLVVADHLLGDALTATSAGSAR